MKKVNNNINNSDIDKINKKNFKSTNKEKKLNKIKENAFVKKILDKKFVSKFFTKEVILYIVFGLLTTAINVGSFSILTYLFFR